MSTYDNFLRHVITTPVIADIQPLSTSGIRTVEAASSSTSPTTTTTGQAISTVASPTTSATAPTLK